MAETVQNKRFFFLVCGWRKSLTLGCCLLRPGVRTACYSEEREVLIYSHGFIVYSRCGEVRNSSPELPPCSFITQLLSGLLDKYGSWAVCSALRFPISVNRACTSRKSAGYEGFDLRKFVPASCAAFFLCFNREKCGCTAV